MKKFAPYKFLFLFFITVSCNAANRSQLGDLNLYWTQSNEKSALSVFARLNSYSDITNRRMNYFMGFAILGIQKEQYEFSAGSFIATVLLVMTGKQDKKKVDASFVKSGDIRIFPLLEGLEIR